MGLTSATLKQAATFLAAATEKAREDLNARDGALGDGDLGITVATGWREVAAIPDLPDDVGLALLAWAKAFQRVSSSSYGTLTATALMAAAKLAKGRTDIPWGEVPSLIAAARDAVKDRGKGEFGDKSVLDTLDAVATASAGRDEPAPMLAAAQKAAGDTLDRFRDKPNLLGRARMFGDKSIGLDDPGMVAFKHMVDGLG